jgi:hypothetical protein
MHQREVKENVNQVEVREDRKPNKKDQFPAFAEKQCRTKKRDMQGRGAPQRTRAALRQILAAARRSSCRCTASELRT